MQRYLEEVATNIDWGAPAITKRAHENGLIDHINEVELCNGLYQCVRYSLGYTVILGIT